MSTTRSMAARLPDGDYPYPQLPDEVISIIAENCDLETAKTMRLVNSAASYGSAKVLFSEVNVKSDRAGIERLKQIASSDRNYASYVHYLSIRAPTHPNNMYLGKLDAEDIALIDAHMKSFRNLRVLNCKFCSQIILARMMQSPELILFMSTLVKSALDASSQKAGLPTKLVLYLESKNWPWVRDHEWGNLYEFAAGPLARARSLELAVIRACRGGPPLWTHAIIAPMLRSCRNVVSLELSRKTGFWLNIEGATTTTQYDFPCLRKLTLDSIVATGRQLINLLSGCHATLEEFRIRRVQLAQLEWYPGVAAPANFQAQTESWSDVFEYFMNNCPSLYLFKHHMLANIRHVGLKNLVEYRMDENTQKFRRHWGKNDQGRFKGGIESDVVSLGKLLIHLKTRHKARFGKSPHFGPFETSLINFIKYTDIYPWHERGPRRQAAIAAEEGISRCVRLSLLE